MITFGNNMLPGLLATIVQRYPLSDSSRLFVAMHAAHGHPTVGVCVLGHVHLGLDPRTSYVATIALVLHAYSIALSPVEERLLSETRVENFKKLLSVVSSRDVALAQEVAELVNESAMLEYTVGDEAGEQALDSEELFEVPSLFNFKPVVGKS